MMTFSRSFRNGKMSLSEVEATRDLLSAQTESQRRLVVGDLERRGNGADVYTQWRQLLIKVWQVVEE